MKKLLAALLGLLLFPLWSYGDGPVLYRDTTTKSLTRAVGVLEVGSTSKWTGVSDAGTVPSAGSLTWIGVDPADGVLKVRKSSGDGGALVSLEAAGGGGESPTGSIMAFGGSSAPSGWFLCDGSEYSQTTYATLYAVLGSTWNTGGETAGYFRVPDLRGRGPIGSGTGSGLTARTLGATGGEENHQLSVAELAAHSHNAYVYASFGAQTSWFGGGPKLNAAALQAITQSAGSNTAHNTMQPFAVVTYIIKQ